MNRARVSVHIALGDGEGGGAGDDDDDRDGFPTDAVHFEITGIEKWLNCLTDRFSRLLDGDLVLSNDGDSECAAHPGHAIFHAPDNPQHEQDVAKPVLVDMEIGSIQQPLEELLPVIRGGCQDLFADLVGFESLERSEAGDRIDFGFHAVSDGGALFPELCRPGLWLGGFIWVFWRTGRFLQVPNLFQPDRYPLVRGQPLTVPHPG